MKYTIKVFKEKDWWVAQLQEYDIAVQAKTMEDACYQFGKNLKERSIVCKKHGMKVFEGIPKKEIK